MKRLLILFVFIAFVATSCSEGDGQLHGVQPRPEFYQADPFGTVYIPMGSFNMGPNDEEVTGSLTTKAKTVSVQAFYIDDAEISNNEYRQFVFHVRDSIARRWLAIAEKEEYVITEEDYYANNPIFKGIEADAYPDENKFKQLDWYEKIRWNEADDEDYRLAIEPLYLPKKERFYNRKQIDARKLNYEYYWMDLKLAASKSNRFLPEKTPQDQHFNQNTTQPGNINYKQIRTNKPDPMITGEGTYDVKENIHKPNPKNSYGDYDEVKYNTNTNDPDPEAWGRAVFIVRDIINVYPDTLAWVHDFTYSFNEPMTNMYFWHPAYDDYPVVGVSWKQARAFCVWRSLLLNNFLIANGETIVNEFRLPTESEWEYAARGGHELSAFPWGGPYIRNSMGCFLGNFKPMRGSYMDDGGFHTVKIYSYNPNDYGLFCMAGNAAEWTSNAFDESAYDFNHDLNPDYIYEAQDSEPNVLKRKVIRGGSWKDVGQYLQVSQRTYEYQDTAKCYIGFRCVMTYLGRSKDDEL